MVICLTLHAVIRVIHFVPEHSTGYPMPNSSPASTYIPHHLASQAGSESDNPLPKKPSTKLAPMQTGASASVDPRPLGKAPLPATSAVPKVASGPAEEKGMLAFSMPKLLACVDELNELAGDGCAELMAATKGHVLRTQEAVCLVVYQDGMKVRSFL